MRSGKDLREIGRLTRRQEETADGEASRLDWLDREDEYLLEHAGSMTLTEMALGLGRSFYATKFRLAKLRKEARQVGTKLKRILEENGIGTRAFAREIGIPTTNMHVILTEGKFADKDVKNGVKQKLFEALLKRGISAKGIFELERSTNARAQRGRPAMDSTTSFENEWEAEMLDQATLNHFGLAEDPFHPGSVREAADMFWTRAHKDLRESMKRAIERRDFIAVSGEVGCGKTLVRKAVMENLDDKVRVIEPALTEKEALTPYNLQEAIIADLRAAQPDYNKPTRASKEARDRQIKELLELHDQAGLKVVIICEEAHALRLDILRTFKRLYEMSVGFKPLLGIILLGQPEMIKHWEDLRVREFSRRCRLLRLPDLRPAEMAPYIEHKFKRVNASVGAVFAADGVSAIADRFKKGAPALQVNNLCARAMNSAAEAQVKKINGEFVAAVS